MNETLEKEALVPKLRFPEFLGEWLDTRIGEICPFQRGFDLPSYEIEGGSVPIIYSNGVGGTHARGMAFGPGIVTGRSGTIGKTHYIASGPYWPHNTTLWVTAFHKCDPLFAFYLLRSFEIERYGTGSGVPTLNRNSLHEHRIAVPLTLDEQRKIAECLQSLDELISAEMEKLEALKRHKKGLLQQLFPAEGETTPRLRFPRFQACPDWKPIAFADALKDYFYGTSKACGPSGDYKVLRMANMFDGGLHVRNLTYTDLSPKEFETLRLHPGDILLNRTNSIDLVGRVSLFDLEGDYVTASYIVVFRLKAELVDSRYCNYFLNTPASQRLIRSMATRAVSQANVNPSSFRKNFQIALPSLKEQRYIADSFSESDKHISHVSEAVQVLRLHKAALMQQLFPSLEELDAPTA